MAQPPNLVVVALCSGMRHGKDTAAAHLVEAHGFQHVKLAQQLKEGVRSFFDFTHDQVEGDAKDVIDPRWGLTPRSALQWMGTEVMQHHLGQELLPSVGRTFWARQLVQRINGLHEARGSDSTSRFVISDMRFLHEHACLVDAFGSGFISIRIVRPAAASSATAHHTSECEWGQVPAHVTVVNDSDIPTLFSKVTHELSVRGALPPRGADAPPQ